MSFTLQRPLLFFDLETTGTRPDIDKIIDLAAVRLNTDGSRDVFTFRFNPGRPIPPGATAVHGIGDRDVAGMPVFADRAAEVKRLFQGADVGGFNVLRFDLPMLQAEFARCGIAFPDEETFVVDAMAIFHRKESGNPALGSKNLEAALRFYCNKRIENAHEALSDTEASIDVFFAQLARYSDMGSTVAEAAAYCNDPKRVDADGKLRFNDDGEIVFSFGKHVGKRVKDNLDYAAWMLKSDFHADTKHQLKLIIEGKK